ncbi:hypothetical protein F5888DRAFT_1736282 [Russula emetica]|nr:hypothetical protein F5888DRAFT_1736282 [Russula emetica]
MLPLRLSTLFICCLARRLEALGKPSFVVPLARVTARKVKPTLLAEVDAKRVRLCVFAVPLECAPLLELGVGTESALDLANRTACSVGLRRYE